ncbi:MAG: 50S ribosomal protein L24 [Candidatus Dadabacteria bacterium]|nr:MAG: 50S ribosomal protein L24 [Candidatus Dadabacteria bacterium]
MSGGNSKKRDNKGKVGTIRRFVWPDRVVVEGLNFVSKHQKQTSPDKPAGKVPVEAPVHISNVMYYAEKIERPVRLCCKRLEDGTKVRGYKVPGKGDFVQID